MSRILLAEFGENTGDPLAMVLTKAGHTVLQTFDPRDDGWMCGGRGDFDIVIIADAFAKISILGFEQCIRGAIERFGCQVFMYGHTDLRGRVESAGARWLDYQLDDSVVKALAT